jgi:hypothetical protein
MTTFPALIPSSRTFTPGEYPATAFSGYSGVQNRVRHSNAFLAAQVRLSFLGLTQAQMLDVWNHYNGRRGEFRSFELPAEVVSYSSITDYVPGTYMWRYAGPGSVEDLPCGGHNVSLILETVPPSAASVVGAQLFTSLRLATGAVNGGEYVPGSNEIIALSFSVGAAITALNGFNQSMILGLTPGSAQGDTSTDGAALSMIFWANYGQGASLSSLGVKKEIAFNLSAGGADNGINLDPDFADVSLLLHMDGSNGSTTFTDSSSNARTCTPSGTVTVSTTESKFGGASAFLNGGAITFNNADSKLTLQPDASDWTIEMWIYTGAGNGVIIYSDSVSNRLELNSFNVRYVAQSLVVFNNVSAGLTANTWHHLAITSQNGTHRLFRDGLLIATMVTVSNSFTVNVLGNAVGLTNYIGYIDDLRITKGVARYTANFTPPTTPFPNS